MKAQTSAPLGPVAIALRLLVLLGIVVAATWLAHHLRDALNLTVMPENEQAVHRALMVGAVAYIGLLAMPFVPGAEIGIAMLTAFGASIVPLVYVATVVAMLLAYLIGCFIPIGKLERLLGFLRLHRASELVARAAPLSRDERIEMLMEGAPPRAVAMGIRHRYVALALAVNLPGNSIVGGGGGIMIMAGLSGLFAPVQTFLTVAIAVSPVPLAVAILGL